MIYALSISGTPDTSAGSSNGSAGAARCRSTQLPASFLPGGSAGTALGPFFIRNASGRACAIPDGSPALQFTFRGSGLPVVVKPWPPADRFGELAGRVLGLGAKVYLKLGWRAWCPPEGTPSVPGCSEVARPTVTVSRPLR